MNFILLLPTGNCITQNTLIKGKDSNFYIETPEQLCRIMKNKWKKETGSTSFQDWADSLNDSGDYDGTFHADDALDNLASAYHLNIDGKAVNVMDYFNKYANEAQRK